MQHHKELPAVLHGGNLSLGQEAMLSQGNGLHVIILAGKVAGMAVQGRSHSWV